MTLPFAQVSFPEAYEQALVGPLFRPFAETTLDELNPSPGARVLDVACGTGIVARLARQRLNGSGKVVGVDVNPGMLAVARMVDDEIEWREGNAMSLPLGEREQFDIVTCQQGLQFVPDRAAAIREMQRALSPGGRVAVSTWRSDDECTFGLELRRVAERHVGPIMDRRHSLAEAGELEALLRDAGFRGVRCRRVTHTVRFSNGAVFTRLNAMALVGMSTAGKDMTDEDREQVMSAIMRDSEDVMQRHTDAHGLAYEIATNVAFAVH